MTSSRSIKKATNKRPNTVNNDKHSSVVAMKSLPRDLLVEVIASVASNSFVDLQNMKMCSKDFLDATEDKYVWQRVSLDAFPLIQWSSNDKTSSFLERCRKSENIESLYREGLLEYFNYSGGNNIDGLGILKMAAQKGHKEAKYVCGVILLCSKDDELRKQGLEHMRFLRKSKCVVRCRKKVKQLLSSMWKKNAMLMRNESPLCNSKSTCRGWKVKKGRWVLIDDDDDDDDNISSCESCRWDHELEFFYKLFNVH